MTQSPSIKASTLKPFAAGDIFLGCTYLMNVPGDDHAGEGRILQYDRNRVPKGTLYTEGTTPSSSTCVLARTGCCGVSIPLPTPSSV